MTLDEIDASLAHWRERLAAASRNVTELSELPAYLGLRIRMQDQARASASMPRPVPAVSVTDTEAAALVGAMDELWQCVKLIGHAIDRAETLRPKALGRLIGGGAAIEAIREILEGDSIELELADRPVLRRGLLGGTQDKMMVSLDRLLELMVATFDKAKATLERIVAARNHAAAAIVACRADAETLSKDKAAELAAVLSALDQVAVLAETDPLGALERIAGEIRPAIEAAGVAAARVCAARAAADSELAAASAAMAEIAELDRVANDALAQCRTKISDLVLVLPGDAEARELPGWLDKLRSHRQAGKFDALQAGLRRWRDLQMKVADDRKAVIAESGRLLERRETLRGRIGALQAKYEAMTARGAVPDPAIEADAARLRGMLFGAATPLGDAERLIMDYEARLARLSTKR